jgi:hypothetical protein
VSLVFAWYFPNRDHFGAILGNFYSGLYTASDDVAAALAAPGVLPGVVSDLNAHHGVFAGPGSSLPDWLADSLINSMSHFRSVMWFAAGGIWRQWEGECKGGGVCGCVDGGQPWAGDGVCRAAVSDSSDGWPCTPATTPAPACMQPTQHAHRILPTSAEMRRGAC